MIKTLHDPHSKELDNFDGPLTNDHVRHSFPDKNQQYSDLSQLEFRR